jgi:hypothetical protein
LRRLLFAITAALSLAYAKLVGGPMDGTQWDIKLKPDAIFSFSHKDTLVFSRGQLSIVGGTGSDLPPAVYSAESLDSDTADTVWHASLTRPETGVVTWHGLVRGDQIEGVAVWWTRDGKPKRYTFHGSRRA